MARSLGICSRASCSAAAFVGANCSLVSAAAPGESVCSQLLFAEMRFATRQGLFPGCSQPPRGTQGAQGRGSESRSPVTMHWSSSTQKRPRMSFSPQIRALATFTHCHQPSPLPGGALLSFNGQRCCFVPISLLPDGRWHPHTGALSAWGEEVGGIWERGEQRAPLIQQAAPLLSWGSS